MLVVPDELQAGWLWRSVTWSVNEQCRRVERGVCEVDGDVMLSRSVDAVIMLLTRTEAEAVAIGTRVKHAEAFCFVGNED